MNDALQAKLQRLIEIIRPLKRVVVAFSAGVDSTVVLKVAMDALGKENVLAATGVSPSLAQRELQSVRDLASLMEAPLELVGTSEMDNPSYSSNPINRCYFCKSELYTKLQEIAEAKGYLAILNGVNHDDRGDFRPGMEAADQWRVKAPLLEAQISKAEVREIAQTLALPNWEKPALACLSSRIPYGTPVTIGSLGQVEKAEGFLWDRGFKNFRRSEERRVGKECR